MEDAWRRTRALIAALDSAQLMGPRWSIVNLLRWEIGHAAAYRMKIDAIKNCACC